MAVNKIPDTLLLLLLPLLIIIHLLAAPYTKVEESFTIQATHDILVYGTPIQDAGSRFRAAYDHFTFPGAVPRSFVGPVLLAGLSQPFIQLVGFAHAQFVVRAVLGLFNAGCMLAFARSLKRALGRDVMRWWVLLMSAQFHVLFYVSRTLPNMFAFGLATLASAQLVPHPDPRRQTSRQRIAISALVFASVIFRSEVALLLGSTGLFLLTTRQASLHDLFVPFATSFLAALALSVPLDSYFWQKWLWPELWGFWFNVVHGGASEWGVSPWHFYFTSALPRLLLNPLSLLLLIPIACLHPATSHAARFFVTPNLLFLALYSFQPHKEARFIFYVVPPLTAAAAQGAHFIFTRRSKSKVYALASILVPASILASFAAATAMLLLSTLNYPGGEALSQLYKTVDASYSRSADASAVPAVHADVLSCMSGVTLFGQNRAGLPLLMDGLQGRRVAHRAEDGTLVLDFDRSESESLLRNPDFWSRFDYLLVEDTSKVLGGGSWETVAAVEGYAGVEMLRPSQDNESSNDPEGGKSLVVGKGRCLKNLRRRVRALTGGWWVGPRMEPRINILRRVKSGGETTAVASE